MGRILNTVIIAVCLTLSINSATANGLGSTASKTDDATAQRHYDGDRITLQFQNIDIHKLLQVVAKTANLNFVVSNTVKGTMSLELVDVPWDQALNIILKSNGLGTRHFGKVWLIAPITELADKQIQELQVKQKLEDLAPIKTNIIRLKFANAEAISNLLRGDRSTLLSSRGQVGIDKRTNSIIVRDTAKNIRDVYRYVRTLDVPARQVLIKAKIISIKTIYQHELGVRFGVTNPNHLSGTLRGANALAGGTAMADVPIGQRLNFNLPATSLFENPGSIAVALAKIGGTYIDAELSALESEGIIDVIASPRLVTSNQETAYIKQGEEIPYLESTSSGATNIAFKDAVLRLDVTPQITPNNRIVLKVKIQQNSRGKPTMVQTTVTEPAIDTEELGSDVLLKNKETVVIGGIFKRSNTRNYERIPFFYKIPIIGDLFKHKDMTDERRELLIFLTPIIVDQNLPKRFDDTPCYSRRMINAPLPRT